MASPTVMAVGKDTSNPLNFNDSPLTGVNTPGCDENSMKLMVLMYILSGCCWQDTYFIAADHRDSADVMFLLLKVEGNPLLGYFRR